MTALFEIRVRIGGDPRHLSEFQALREQLAGLNHPARPDVDWSKVEQLCVTLFEKNGADLQSAVALVLARSHRYGLDGMLQGLALVDALLAEWPRTWPTTDPLRLEILDWLFTQLQSLLRGLADESFMLPALVQLQAQLERIHSGVQPRAELLTLQVVRQMVAQRMQRAHVLAQGGLLLPRSVEPGQLAPVVVISPAPLPTVLLAAPPPGRRRIATVLAGLVLVTGLASWAGWSHWRADQAMAMRLPDPVSLESLRLFNAGSAEFRADATEMLVKALMAIKAQPGWLVVIAGHADNSGDTRQNQQLSQARAVAVREWLQRMGGIPDRCFVIHGAADSQPLASNATEPGRAANRRVDIRLVPQSSSCDLPDTLG